MKFQTAYDYEGRADKPVYLPELDEAGEPITKTKQDQAADCDINNIMAKYQKTGLITHLSTYAGYYGNADQVAYETAFDLVNNAHEAFDTLPSTVRAQFENDPALWLGAIEEADTPEKFQELVSGESGAPEPSAPASGSGSPQGAPETPSAASQDASEPPSETA